MDESLDTVRILMANRKAVQAIFNAVLIYKDGSENPNGALHLSNVVGLAEAGVKVEYDEDCNMKDIPKDELREIEAGKARYLQYLEDLKKQKENLTTA